MAAICRAPIPLEMKVKTPAISSGETQSYVQLQHQIHDALREQHPDWVQPNGDCPTCESVRVTFGRTTRHFSVERTQVGRLIKTHDIQAKENPSGQPTPLFRYTYIYEYDRQEPADRAKKSQVRPWPWQPGSRFHIAMYAGPNRIVE